MSAIPPPSHERLLVGPHVVEIGPRDPEGWSLLPGGLDALDALFGAMRPAKGHRVPRPLTTGNGERVLLVSIKPRHRAGEIWCRLTFVPFNVTRVTAERP